MIFKIKKDKIDSYIILDYTLFKELYLDTNIKPYLSLHKEYVSRLYDGDINPWTSTHYFILLDNKYLLSAFNKKGNNYGWIPIEFRNGDVLQQDLNNDSYGRTPNINLAVEQFKFPLVYKYNDYETIKYHYEKCREFELKVVKEKEYLYKGWGFGEDVFIPTKYIKTDSSYNHKFLDSKEYDALVKYYKTKEDKNKVLYNKIKKYTLGIISIEYKD